MAKKSPAKPANSAKVADAPTVAATAPAFLVDLVDARSPSGHEFEAQAVVDKYMKPVADAYAKDTIGNRLATLNPKGDTTLMFAGHIDEIALTVSYIDDRGYLYFDFIGGHDLVIPSGRRVTILTKNGDVLGVTGKRAVHLMSPEDRKKVPERHDMWIDIGVTSRAEAEKLVRISDPIVYRDGFEILRGSLAVARAFDDKAGAYICMEALRRLAADKKSVAAKVVAVATTQEEIGVRGAQVAAQAVQPHVAIAVDVTHATDHPDADNRKFGRYTLSGGPVIGRGPNLNPIVVDRMIACAEKLGIPYQIQCEARPTGTDARAIQMAGPGVACGLLSIPLRYMHTPGEIVDLKVVEQCVQLLVEFAKSVQKGERFEW